MKYPFKITINDQKAALRIKDDVQIGHYFVFVKHKRAISVDRLERLLVNKYYKTSVLPLVNQPVKLDGVTITPEPRQIEPIGCIVSDAKFYRAEQDVVRLFIAFPKPPDELLLVINCNGELFTTRKVKLSEGVGIETLLKLPSGDYDAQLSTSGQAICLPVFFRVAEYTPPLLSAEFINHKFDEKSGTFLFQLAVESYQIPFEGELIGTLIEQGLEIADNKLKQLSPGRYAGQFSMMSSEGSFRLQLMAVNDNERVTEIAIPSTKVEDSKATVISELGQEIIFSMAAKPEALPLRGGYLAEGDFLSTPLMVDSIVSENYVIEVKAEIKSLVLVNLDLISGEYQVQEVGDVTVGDRIMPTIDSTLCMVFTGGFVDEKAFEGYTSFIKPKQFQLSVDAPKKIRPYSNLVVRLTGVEDRTIPVLLSVREGIKALAEPQVSLGSAIKHSIETATMDMDRRAFIMMDEVVNDFSQVSSPKISVSHNAGKDTLVDFQVESEFKNKFDLAQWFWDLGDGKSAEKILIEIVDKANGVLESRAKDMLRAISGEGTRIGVHTANKFGLPLIDIESVDIAPDVVTLIDKGLLSKYHALPIFKRGDYLFVALSDPQNNLSAALDEIESHTNLHTEAILAEAEKLDNVIENVLELFGQSMKESGKQIDDKKEIEQALEFFDLRSDEVEGEDFDEALFLEDNFYSDKTDIFQASLSPNEIVEIPNYEFEQVVFYDIIPVCGSQELVIPLDGSVGNFVIESFAMSKDNWTQNCSSIVINKAVRVELVLPPAIYPDDKVIGRLRATTSGDKALLSLMYNGKTLVQRKNAFDALSMDAPVDFQFIVKVGTYFAKVEDPLTGETDSIEVVVGEMGQFKFYTQGLGFLVKEDSIDSKTALSVVPNIELPFRKLLTATANYPFMCCEQIAAKVLAATFMYMIADNDEERSIAEQLIDVGIAQEKKMMRKDLGFALYPESYYVSEYHSELTVRYLWYLKELEDLPTEISPLLSQAIGIGISLADNGAMVHQMQAIPDQIQSIEDAYSLARAGKDSLAIRQFIDNMIDFSETPVVVQTDQGAVAERTMLAYAGACLIAIGDLERGMILANQVTAQFNEEGRLYSTVDSVAAIVLMMELRRSELKIGEARLRVNGKEMLASEAVNLNDDIESIEVLDGVAAVELRQESEEDWQVFSNSFPVEVEILNYYGIAIEDLSLGDRLELMVSLPEGYQAGDLLQVSLAPCLSWIKGDNTLFSVDFEGSDELRIPLIVSSSFEGEQHFAVCIRNMFEEERASSPGLLTVKAH
jgi:FimV-like protein